MTFAAEMSTKFDGQETPIAVDTVGSNVLALGATPTFFGPFTLRGAYPLELRSGPYWMEVDGSDNATVYTSLADLKAKRGPVDLASWDLSPDIKTLDDGVTAVVGFADVDATENTFTVTDHGWTTGDAVRVTSSDTLPTGVAGNTTYYVYVVDADVFKLSDTEAHALAGTDFIDATNQGAGDHTFTLCRVDLTANVETLRLDSHGMQTGDGPVRFTTSGALPTGLSAGVDYWIIRYDANRFQVATSQALALAGTEVDLTGIGSGTHQLVRALEIGIDLSADGIVLWLAQGIKKEAMVNGLAADADTIFV